MLTTPRVTTRSGRPRRGTLESPRPPRPRLRHRRIGGEPIVLHRRVTPPRSLPRLRARAAVLLNAESGSTLNEIGIAVLRASYGFGSCGYDAQRGHAGISRTAGQAWRKASPQDARQNAPEARTGAARPVALARTWPGVSWSTVTARPATEVQSSPCVEPEATTTGIFADHPVRTPASCKWAALIRFGQSRLRRWTGICLDLRTCDRFMLSIVAKPTTLPPDRLGREVGLRRRRPSSWPRRLRIRSRPGRAFGPTMPSRLVCEHLLGEL